MRNPAKGAQGEGEKDMARKRKTSAKEIADRKREKDKSENLKTKRPLTHDELEKLAKLKANTQDSLPDLSSVENPFTRQTRKRR